MQQKDRNPRLTVYLSPSDMDKLKAVSGLNGMACFARSAIMAAVERHQVKSNRTHKAAPAKAISLPAEDTKKTPAKRTWQDVRDIKEAWLRSNGLDPAVINARGIEQHGEQGHWELYMTTPDCAQMLELHDDTIR